MQAEPSTGPELDFDSPRLQKQRKARAFKDKLARYSIAGGGVSVIVAVTLIFFYLLYEVVPLFQTAEIEAGPSYPVPGEEVRPTRLMAVEELNQKAMRLDEGGYVTFFNLRTGELDRQFRLPLAEGVEITSLNESAPGSREVVLGLSNGQVLSFQHNYKVTFPKGRERLITPELVYPKGEEPQQLAPEGEAIKAVALRSSGSSILTVGVTEANRLYGKLFSKEENFLTGEVTLESRNIRLPETDGEVIGLQISPNTRWLYLALDTGKIEMYDIRKRNHPRLIDTVQAVDSGRKITHFRYLLGGYALLVADDRGTVVQWFPVRDDNNDYSLQRIRAFSGEADGIEHLLLEERRKGFVTLSQSGHAAIFNTTAERKALDEELIRGTVVSAALSPRMNRLLLESSDGQIHVFKIENEHSDVSFTALWNEVWYEGYAQEDYVWQSSAATTDFEPKYSLVPLTFGTLKAAFYAMLIAVPLAICGAIYTAHFMAPAVRRKVKPAIELMEALPTVILGFLAGLFFAPYMEDHLPGVFAVLILVPIAILVFGFMWANAPRSLRQLIPEGYDPVLLIPVILLVGWFSFEISRTLEIWLFDGDMRLWLQHQGVDYSQRNSLVVGAAMGFAVIPTIFSITEDAIFSVPKHLSFGSLALGATPWQTLTRVVLPTASPGIFSAVMIGLGRAVGETMIVLMATGNTPIMDMNIFEGMRTLSANIAVEMPESEVGSSHYRILFLAGFVLFLFTFFVNTIAEFVRQRLRNRYSVI